MEEILASIRRIIEDSDSGRKAADEAVEPHVAGDTAPDDAHAPEVDAFRAELHASPAKPVTLSEVQAQLVVAASEETVPPKAANADSITADWQRELAAAAVSELSAPRDANGAKPREPAAPAIEAEETESEPAASPAAGEIQQRSPLVSEQTSRQVAAAFGELSEAFASRSRKSFDEMAEEMLRPMLQDWLDNNLPTLVERLVREEIERVARGG